MRKLAIIIILLMALTVRAQVIKPTLGTPVDFGHHLSKGLVGLWVMNEGCGNTTYDQSGNGLTGTLGGGASWALGINGHTIYFQNNYYVTVADSPAFDDTANALSVVALVQPEFAAGAGNANFIADKTAGNDDAFRLLYNATAGSFRLRIPEHATANLDATFSWSAYDWIHIAATWNGSVRKIYCNGVLNVQDNSTGTITIDSQAFLIGASAAGLGNYEWEGVIDHVYLYNRALTESEVLELYQDPFCMFEQDNIALLNSAIAAPSAPGQVIFIQMSAIPLLLILCIVFTIRKKRK